MTVERLTDSLRSSMVTHTYLWIGAITLLYGWAAIVQSLPKPFWFDEIFTEAVAALPRVTDIWQALPAYGSPPVTILLTRLFHRVFGSGELVSRLPQIISFWLMSLCIFFFVKRRTDAAWGIAAMMFPMLTAAFYYAVEARAYALLLGFGGVSLLSWQIATTSSSWKRAAALAVMGVAIGLAVLSHYYAAQIVLVLMIGEVVRTKGLPKIDWAVWLSFIFGMSPLVILASTMMKTSNTLFAHIHSTSGFAYPATLLSPYHFFAEMFSPAYATLFIAGLVVLVTRAGWSSKKPSAGRVSYPSHELAAVLAFAALPIIMTLVTRVTTGHFFSRYAIPALIGCFVIFAFVGNSAFQLRSIAPVTIIACCLLATISRAAINTRYSLASPRLQGLTGNEKGFPSQDRKPIVIADPMAFLPLTWYSRPEIAKRFCYVSDLQEALHVPDFVPEIALLRSKEWSTFPVQDYASFLKDNPSFWVYSTNNRFVEWLLSDLLRRGEQVELQGIVPGGSFYRVSCCRRE